MKYNLNRVRKTLNCVQKKDSKKRDLTFIVCLVS